MNSFEAVPLDQLDNSAKTGLHVGRQRIEFISNSIVEQLHDPRHYFTLLHFCNVARGERLPNRQTPADRVCAACSLASRNRFARGSLDFGRSSHNASHRRSCSFRYASIFSAFSRQNVMAP